MNALGTALREARQIAGLSQSDLGRAIGRTQNNLSEIESGGAISAPSTSGSSSLGCRSRYAALLPKPYRGRSKALETKLVEQPGINRTNLKVLIARVQRDSGDRMSPLEAALFLHRMLCYELLECAAEISDD